MAMQIIAVNHSVSANLRKTAFVLDAYLQRFDTHVHQGFLSKEGFEELKKELDGVKSKNTHLQFYWIHEGRFDPLHHIGSLLFDTQALWTSIGIKLKESRRATPPVFYQSLHDSVKVACLFHDIGKANKCFQTLMRHTKRTGLNDISHEIISTFIFKQALESSLEKYSSILTEKSFTFESKLLYRVVEQTIATHHGVLLKANNEKAFFTSERWKSSSDKSKIDLSLDLLSDAFIRKLQTSLNSLMSSKATINPEAYDFYGYTNRFFMMLGDACESSYEAKSDEFEAVTPESPLGDGCFAKSNKKVLLERHLTGVESFARKGLDYVFMQKHARLQTPKKILKNMPLKGSRFYWQTDLRNKIIQADIKENDGAFIAVLGQTGSGKTRACYIGMDSLSPNGARFTLALGYGALAIQAGKEYISEIVDIEQADKVAIVVGKRFNEKVGETKDQLNNGFDEAFELETLKGITKVNAKGRKDIYDALFGQNSKMVGMFESPVCTMTIDHIIKASTSNRNSFVSSTLRLATSDLIIDEIDSFGAEELNHIGRLCYLSGLFGKRVIIASATIPPEILKPMYDAYEAGFKTYNEANGNKGRLFSGISSDIDMGEGGDCFTRIGENVIDELPSILKNISQKISCPRRKIESLFIDNGYQETLLKKCFELACDHKNNQVTQEQVPISFGFLRFNLVRETISFARYLLKSPEVVKALEDEFGFELKIQVHHGRMDSVSKTTIESSLNRFMKRKSGNEWESSFKSFLGKVPQKPIVFLLITSPIIEVGIDWDFDWAILEPCSEKSLIQASGRVLRHRPNLKVDKANIILMNKSIRHLESLSSNKVESDFNYGNRGPGVEQVILGEPFRLESLRISKPTRSRIGRKNAVEAKTVEEVFGVSIYSEGLHSGHRISPEPITDTDKLERRQISYALGYDGEASEKYILKSFLEGFKFSKEYLISDSFRDAEGIEYTLKEDDKGIKLFISKRDLSEDSKDLPDFCPESIDDSLFLIRKIEFNKGSQIQLPSKIAYKNYNKLLGFF